MPQKPLKRLSNEALSGKSSIEVQRTLARVNTRRQLLSAIKVDSRKQVATVRTSSTVPTMIQNWFRRQEQEQDRLRAISEHDRRLAIAAAERQRRHMAYNERQRKG